MPNPVLRSVPRAATNPGQTPAEVPAEMPGSAPPSETPQPAEPDNPTYPPEAHGLLRLAA